MKTIFLTNDDGIQAKGLQTLARLMSRLGRVVVVAPDGARSGAACSITPTIPVELKQYTGALPEMPECPVGEYPIEYYTCSGTPVDCVKLGHEQVLKASPDLMVSGINHGDNASCSVHYSGTMGAVIEATLKGWPSIGYSLRTFDKNADFCPYFEAIVKIADTVLKNDLPQDQCLNVNFPEVEKLQGIRVARMARGQWSAEWAEAHNPHGRRTFWLTGHFTNLEPECEDTDYWALDHGYASVTPVKLDMTAYETMDTLREQLYQ